MHGYGWKCSQRLMQGIQFCCDSKLCVISSHFPCVYFVLISNRHWAYWMVPRQRLFRHLFAIFIIVSILEIMSLLTWCFITLDFCIGIKRNCLNQFQYAKRCQIDLFKVWEGIYICEVIEVCILALLLSCILHPWWILFLALKRYCLYISIIWRFPKCFS